MVRLFYLHFMAAPTLYGEKTWSEAANSAATTIPLPTSFNTADRWFGAYVSDANGQTFTPPDGNWTEEWNDISVQSAFSFGLSYRTGGSANAAFSLGTSERQAGVSFAVSGAASGVHAKGSPDQTGSSGTAVIPGLTTTVNDCLVIGVVGTDVSAGDTAPTTPSGWTLVASKYQLSGGLVCVYQRTQATAGIISDTNVTLAVSEQWIGVSFALAPATGTSHNLTAAIAIASTTPNAALNVARAITASVVAISDTPNASLAVTRSLSSNIAVASATPAASLNVTRSLTSDIVVASTTPNALLNIARLLASNISIVSVTQDARFAGDILLTANIAIASNTPNATLAVGRSLTAAPTLISNTPDAIFAIGVNLQSAIAIASVTTDAELNISRFLSSAIALDSNTPNAAMTVSRSLTSNIAVQSQTPDAVLAIVRLLIASIVIGSQTNDAVLSVPISPGVAKILWAARVAAIKWSA